MASLLLPHELQSALWGKLEAHMRERLADHRARLEGDLPKKDTIRLRARIAECKAFLALAEGLTPDQVADD